MSSPALQARNRSRSVTSSRNRGGPIGIVFDLDDTLAPDTTSQLLAYMGVEPSGFWAGVKALMRQGWDQVPAYMWALKRETPISRSLMEAAAPTMLTYPGVPEVFDTLRRVGSAGGLQIEFFLLSSGLRPIVDNLSFRDEFAGVWASDYEYDDEGDPAFIRNVISFTDKTRPLVEISKGLTQDQSQADPFAVNRRVTEYRIPFSRIVFIGDGLTDVPCFSMVLARGGTSVAVYDPNSLGSKERAISFLDDLRVNTIVPANFTRGSRAVDAISRAITAPQTFEAR
jgi:phosphoserine phosphatase